MEGHCSTGPQWVVVPMEEEEEEEEEGGGGGKVEWQFRNDGFFSFLDCLRLSRNVRMELLFYAA